MTVTDFPDWGTSQDQANKIAITGAPPLNLPTLIGSGTIAALAAGSSSVQGPFAHNQLSYHLWLAVQQASVSASPTIITATVNWIDTNSGQTIAVRSYEILAGPNGTNHTIEIRGPARANSVNVTFVNELHSFTSATIVYDMFAVSRSYLRDIARDIVTAGSGFSPANPNVPFGILGDLSPTLGAGAAVSRTLGLYTGRCILTAFTAGANATLQVEITEPQQGDQILANTTDVWRGLTDAHGNLQANIAMPNLHCLIVLTNLDTVSRACTATLVIDESGE